MIREATLSDAARLAELVRSAWQIGSYKRIPINDDKLRRTVHTFLSDKRHCVFVVDNGRTLRGVLAGTCTQLDICDGRAASDNIFYCDNGEGVLLIEAFVNWAKSKQAKIINMSVSSGLAKADKLIESCGFKSAGGNFYYE